MDDRAIDPPAHESPDGIVLIDLGFMDTPGVIASYLLAGDDGLTLIESGPATTRAHLEQGLRDAGYSLQDVSRIIITHIHLDHGGAAGAILRDHPHMRLSVHPFGAPHMVDPSRLLVSAGRIYEDRMDQLFGGVVGVPEDRLDLLTDGEVIRASGRSLRMLFTPGHASHHVAIFDEMTGTLFTGDAGGVRVQGYDFVAPPTPPPEFAPDLWAETIETLRHTRPARLALTHFGMFDDVDSHLDRLMPGLESAVALARESLSRGGDLAALTARLLDFERDNVGDTEAGQAIRQLELASPTYVSAMGLQRYLKTRGELD
ncbi:MAG TPA: MBL fold metallo-hydrolase [Thermomicrobiales bacterium]|nr:MBL fold metallo-hydrolase [Thermomicrobiales bacterium]